jgi:hypothetical protein
MNATDRHNQVAPPPFSNRYIIEQAEWLGEDTIRALTRPPHNSPIELLHVSFDTAYNEIIYPKYGIALVEDSDLGFDSTGEKILGQYDPMENTAFINVSLRDDPRRAFTCWHEVGGHGVLQGQWLRKEFSRLSRQGCCVTTEASLACAKDTMERQANLFASHAAAPTWFVCHALVELLDLTRPIRYVGPATYTLTFNKSWCRFKVDSFADLCRILAKAIQWRFGGLSVEALSYRIQKMPYIVKDVTVVSGVLHRSAKSSASRDRTLSRPNRRQPAA